MTTVMVQSPIAIRRLARWKRHGVLYETHLARLAGGVPGILVSALGPGRRHRFALMPNTLETVRVAEGWTATEVELTAMAEALLRARGTGAEDSAPSLET